MDRRTFLRRASIATAGVIAADQLDIVEKLGRRFFPGFGSGSKYPSGYGLPVGGVPDKWAIDLSAKWWDTGPNEATDFRTVIAYRDRRGRIRAYSPAAS